MSYASLTEAMVYGTGVERAFRCHVHGDTNPSASVNSVTGLWFCYACGARGKYQVSELTPTQATASVRSMLDRMEEDVRALPESYLDFYDVLGPGPYWLSRFSRTLCRAHRLGVDMTGQFATIPVRDPAGDLYGVVRRDLLDRRGPRYRYPPNVPISRFLYNVHRAEGDVLVLTEGATDAIAAEEAGWPSAVASFRNGLSRAQVDLIHAYDPEVLLVAYDQDQAGHDGTIQVRKALGTSVKVERLTWDTYKDLAAIPLQERTRMFDTLAATYA
jgi:hypothetical protein